jgi:diguanylate cyclase (GGDEF)-like protein/PAS domain S-box-containing protein
LAAEGSNDGLWYLDLNNDEVYFSERWKGILGYKDEEVGTQLDEWFKRIHRPELDRIKAEIASHLEGKTRHFESEHRMLHKDGRHRWVLCRGKADRDSEGKPYCIAGSLTDITEKKEAMDQLTQKAFYDYLTLLPNRAYFAEQLKHAVRSAKRKTGPHFAVLNLDIDRFKVFNDSLGYAAADQLLKTVAGRLEAAIRPGDIIARTGGDEFSILLTDLSAEEDAHTVATRVYKTVEEPVFIDGKEIFLSMSIGIASNLLELQQSEDFLRCAEMAMWEVKTKGGGGFASYTIDMQRDTASFLRLETDLRHAIEREQLTNHYQPIVDLKSGIILGFESLLRWNHQEIGLVSPVEFIPVAEQTGLIVQIGEWVLTEACRQAQSWQDIPGNQGSMQISVNLSSKQFAQGEVVKQIIRSLEKSKLDPTCLLVEITESTIMDNPEAASEMLSKIKEMGVRTAIDDFGTGYSSLSMLNTFPLDVLKVDRSFVGKMESDNKETSIVAAIVNMARSLQLDVVAEGVENLKQVQILKDLGCQYAQGFHFSRPLEPEKIKVLLEQATPLPF